ncbi:hypothetical protein VOLCADRAFT_84711 [Volvox carteri f. nagariensis]|uniref:Uncharacterized protein n=1 Tax=Volvox carteri f. nagariensis TaxID=3068 RepID=D8UJY4_VOLCA|nr:uncharacterized protein VOLCADRAFT_84711 [Volvox carteri f. nagariensis]EFJ39967.1 hypothetical protein VOLCADRAFT_84711 [Volvox carteri f. nagariensis]|eukprot:XP_002958962.1 hypothetical protein VOLCADRAFT_84711 [Volvox carteri f. nagariensis]
MPRVVTRQRRGTRIVDTAAVVVVVTVFPPPTRRVPSRAVRLQSTLLTLIKNLSKESSDFPRIGIKKYLAHISIFNVNQKPITQLSIRLTLHEHMIFILNLTRRTDLTRTALSRPMVSFVDLQRPTTKTEFGNHTQLVDRQINTQIACGIGALSCW